MTTKDITIRDMASHEIASIAPASDVVADQAYQDEIDRVIATCGGDIRGALQALLAANEFLEMEICALRNDAANPHGRETPNRMH